MYSENSLVRWLRRRGPRVFDALAALAMIVVSCVAGTNYFPHPWGSDPLPYALTVLVFLPLALRRVAPIAVLVATCAALAAYLAAGYDQLGLNFWGPLLAAYSVAAQRPIRVTAWCMALVVPITYWSAHVAGLSPALRVLEAVLLPAMAWAFGDIGRQLADRNRKLAAVTEQLSVEQRKRTEQALTNERVRIARELHDVVAHHMSVIAMQTGVAGYVLDTDPATARAALDTVTATSREALDEMRHMLDLLRVSDDPEPGGEAPAPRLGGVGDLVDRVRAAGLDVELEITGTARPLSSGLQLTAYRVIQEALTNVLKHARPCQAWVTVLWRTRDLVVRVVNDGPMAAEPELSGHGVIGMRERARLYSGTLAVGPRPEGGFAVELVLPTPESAPHN